MLLWGRDSCPSVAASELLGMPPRRVFQRSRLIRLMASAPPPPLILQSETIVVGIYALQRGYETIYRGIYIRRRPVQKEKITGVFEGEKTRRKV